MNATATGRARVRTTDGKLYAATVRLDGQTWVHLEEARRLTRHGDGWAGTPVANITIPARRIDSIRWLANEPGEVRTGDLQQTLDIARRWLEARP